MTDHAAFADRFPRTAAVFEAGRAKGQHFGGTLAVSHRGELATFAAGTRGPDETQPMRIDDLLCWRSAGKPITALVLLEWVAEESVDLDAPVADFVPEFGAGGKDAITLRHLLTHTSAMRSPVSGWPAVTPEAIWDRVKDAKLQAGATPGERAAYDPVAAWLALGRVLAAAGIDLPQRVDALFRDLRTASGGTNCDGVAFLGVDEQRYDRLAAADRLAPQFDTTADPPKPQRLHEREACTRPSPGSSLHATAADLARFYRHLLDRLRDSDPTLDAMTRRQREGLFDDSFQHTVDFGLGVIVNSARYGAQTVPYGYGLHASEHTFGHGGAQCAIGFADPEHDLAVAWCLNGLCGEPRHNQRNRRLNTAVYEDLEIAEV